MPRKPLNSDCVTRVAERISSGGQPPCPLPCEVTMHLLGSFSENWVRWQKIQKGALMSRAAFPALKVGAVLLLFQHGDTYSLPSALSGR